MIMSLKGEYVGGPRCGERFPIDRISPSPEVIVEHPEAAKRQGFAGPHRYLMTLEQRPDGEPWDGKTYRYVYAKS
jgi:hypothetical protein